MGAATANSLVQHFAAHLAGLGASSTGRVPVGSILALERSFEGWAKIEFATELMRLRGFVPFVQIAESPVPGDIGLEFTAKLKNGGEKRVDLWVSPSKAAERWHFFELKVAFETHHAGKEANGNVTKQIGSWIDDFDALQNIDREIDGQAAASVSSLLLAVGFGSEEALRDRVAGVRKGLLCSFTPIGTPKGSLFLAHLCRTYPK
jgi:hypothetical protein